ncbi:hypothetical protein K443DRAFT_443534 [Laccaria amethystina LaAM-08-1]|uniref:RanBD1 domain-containing protein n=1 Tax=Laccaria amethystina LaAM-08-1 TaxID=1095629 RepID=A0A0C9WWK8_9AGAR|nr:hypothetical protein K443DRAFT_443534 [Laccaria amethystina LaAM-08-1]
MFPVTDFNFVVAGIATIAATVGYACSRRLSINFLDIPDSSVPTAPTGIASKETKMEVGVQDQERDTAGEVVPDSPNASSQSRRNSLKRKVPHDGFDEPSPDLGYPHNLVNIYPNKRSRTPSTDSGKDDAPTEAPKAEHSIVSLAAMISDEDVVIPFSEDPEPIMATPASEPPRTPSPSLEESTPKAPPPQLPAPASPSLPSKSLPATRPTTPQPSASFGSPNPSGGFAAFAGSTSPFASFNKSQSPLKNSRSIWTANFEEEPSDASSSSLLDISKPSTLHVASKNAIAAVEPASKPATFTHITGEENEDVELELKGVKLYVKRGNRPFSDGMVGHIKLLSDRETLEERLLFRREPLWKISMNFRVKPTVRCTFDAEEGVVRLVLKESVGSQEAGSEAQSGAKEPTQEVVVYALKPGRSCSKQDFKEFAESLLQSSHFKPPKTAMSI